jgi:DNA polymerase IV
VKLKFDDFTRTTVERAGFTPILSSYRQLLAEGFGRADKSVRLMGVGVRFNESSEGAEEQLSLL